MPPSKCSLHRTIAVAIAFATPAVLLSCEGLTPYQIPGSGGGQSSSSATVTSSASSSASSSSSSSSSASSSSASSSSASASSSSASSSSGSGGAGGAGGAPADAGAEMDSSAAGDGANACNTQETLFPILPSPHVIECSPVSYASEPPTSGPHYSYWAAFKTYTAPVPRGFYVHDLEHGAVVILYNCPNGCAPELAQLQAFLAARPADPLCSPPLKNRFVVTPDPLSDVPFAAAAWGAALRSQCFDLPALGAFIDAHYAKAPENFCFDGVDVTSPDAGIPAACGQAMDAGDAGGG